ncbi:MAG: hypothetical protein IJV16_03820 [Lachnospiraceae bacterium]|nr:hypothetical protein [Lachnospiraceae bacterium]
MKKIFNDKKKWIILGEILILILLFSYMLWAKISGNNAKDVGLKIEDMRSDYMYFDDGWVISPEYIDEINTEDYLTVLQGPYIPLPMGDYTVSIAYQSDNNQKVTLYSEDGIEEEENDTFLKANPFPLYSYRNVIEYDFRTTGFIDDFEVRIGYNGKGNLHISQIRVRRNLNFQKRLLLMLLIVFLITDICIFKKKFLEKNRDTIMALTGISLLGIIPLFMPGINKGHDLTYHLNRIDGILTEINLLNIPVRLHSSWLMGMGYPVSIFRGDVLLYVAVLFRIMGFSVIESYKAFIIFINVLTSVVSYFSFNIIFKDKRVSILATLGYVTAIYRYVDIYTRAAVDEYTAMVFFPAVIAAIYMIYTDNEICFKPNLRYATLLAIAMSGIILSHTLSIEMSGILIIMFVVFKAKKTIRPRVLATLLLAGCETILLTLSFIVPFLDYYLNVPMEVTNGFGSGVLKIQDRGAYVSQIFAFFQNSIGSLSGSGGDRSSLTPGILLISCLVVSILYILTGVRDKLLMTVSFFSIVILFLASDLFPWDFLSSNTRLFNMLSAMEFPWRFLSPACAVLAALLGVILVKTRSMSPKLYLVYEYSAIILALLGCIVFYSQYSDNMSKVSYYDTAELLSHVDKGLDDFIRVSQDGNITTFISAEGALYNVEGEIISREGPKIIFDCTTGESQGTVTAPLYNYKGFSASDTSGKSFIINDDEYCRVTFDVPANYHDTITIDFTEPWYWRLAEIVSLLAWVVLIICEITMFVKRRN